MRLVVISLSVLVAAFLGLHGVFDNEAMYGIIHADAQGYYGYLVALFLEQSFDWEQVIRSYADVYFDGGGADFTVQSELGRINKYYAGTALLIAPFFLLACLVAWLFGFPIDGYSAPFQTGIMFCALFYAGVGMYFLSKFIESKGISKSISIFTSICCLFATGLFHYSLAEPAMSHVYSFSLVSLFMYATSKWFSTDKWSDFLLAAIFFGLIVLVRPVNGLIILSVPFLAGGTKPLWERLNNSPEIVKKLTVGIAVVFGILLFQSAMYMAQVGHPLVWSYQDEGFNFLDPEILKVLFSFKKGFFVYSPIAFLGALGLVWMLFKKPKETAWLWLFLGITVYVISSWWNWYYGGGFGMRALIEYLPFFAFGLAYLIQVAAKPARIAIITICLLLVSVNLIQSYQYQKFIIHWVGMDQDKYWQVFLKTGREYDGIFYRDQEAGVQLPSAEFILATSVFESDFEPGFKWGQQGINSERAFSGVQSTLVNQQKQYGSTLGVPVSELGPAGTKLLYITAMVWSEETFPSLTIGYSFRSESKDYGHDYISLGQFVSKKKDWIKVEQIATLTEARDSISTWVVYPVCNHGEGNIYLDDIRYEIITVKD